MIPTCDQRCTVSIDEVYFESLARPSVAQLAIAFALLFAGLLVVADILTKCTACTLARRGACVARQPASMHGHLNDQ